MKVFSKLDATLDPVACGVGHIARMLQQRRFRFGTGDGYQLPSSPAQVLLHVCCLYQNQPDQAEHRESRGYHHLSDNSVSCVPAASAILYSNIFYCHECCSLHLLHVVTNTYLCQ